jgi:predicted DNA-binding transcriptional regulator YafY
MRRADRLFQIIQILRRSTRPVTAAMLAAELEVSRRTVYRDMSDLIGHRVPIEGEAGLGYLLAAEYDMPPLMLTPDELEAVVTRRWPMPPPTSSPKSPPSFPNASAPPSSSRASG